MAVTSASVSRVERPSSPFDKDNVINIREDQKFKLQLMTKSMLDQLKNDATNYAFFDAESKNLLDITKNNTRDEIVALEKKLIDKYKTLNNVKSLSEIQKDIDEKLAKLQGNFGGIDYFVEKIFDTRIINNQGKFASLDEAESVFNTECLGNISNGIEAFKNQELSETLKNYRFELETLEGYTFNTNTDNPIYDQEKGVEFQINTENVTRQTELEFKYTDISKTEKKDLADSEKRRKKDREKALQEILNTLEPETKKGINAINQDDFVAVLKGVLDPNFLAGIEDAAGDKTGIISGDERYPTRYEDEAYQAAFKKAFKKQFKEQFIQKKKYEKSGIDIFQRSEKGKIADIVLAYQKGDINSELAQDLNRLISAEALDVHYTSERNAEYLLKNKVNVDNIFKFLCDFNSDGKVDSTAKGGDLGAVMGLQLYENLLDAGTVEYDEGNKEFKLVDGYDTSRVIERILVSVASKGALDEKLKKAIEYFIAKENKNLTYVDKEGETQTVSIMTGRDENGDISIENFLNFMKDGFEFSDDEEANKKLKTTAGYDIKEYLKVHGDELNVQRDVYETFADSDWVAQRTLEASQDFYASTEDLKDSYWRIIVDEQIEKSTMDRSKMKEGLEKFSENDIAEAKNKIGDKMLIIAMTITDHIFFNLGDNTAAWINMFGGAFGAISQTWFKDKESITRNKRAIKNTLGQYILKRMTPNISLSVAKNAEGKLSPVVGVSVGIDRLVTGKEGASNRRAAGVSSGFLLNLSKISESKFIFSVGAEKAWQTKKNRETVQDLSKKYLVSAQRIGVEGGAGISFKHLQESSPYVGLFYEWDPESGIRQSEELYQSEMDKILSGGGTGQNILWGKAQETGLPIYTSKGEFLEKMKAKIDEKNSNKQFLEEEIDQLADLMEWSGTFDLMKKTNIPDPTKEKALKYVYMAYLEGAKENLSAQKTTTLDKKIKLTRIGARFSLRDIIKVAGGGAATGALLGTATGPLGTIVGTMIGATAASIKMTRYENEWRYDKEKGLFNYKTIGNLHALKARDENPENIESYAQLLEHEVNGRLKYIEVSGEEEDNKGTFTFSKNPEVKGTDDILQYMNVYYSDEALQSGAFSYDGVNLNLGQTEFSTYKVLNKDTDEVFLMIGNNEKGPMKQLTKADQNISRPEIKPLEKVADTSEALTKEQLQTLKVALPEGGNQSTVDAINKAYAAWIEKESIATDLVNGQIIATKNIDGTFSFAFKDTNPREHAEDNKVELIYEQKIFGKEVEGGATLVFDAAKDVLIEFEKDSSLFKAKEEIDRLQIEQLANLERIPNTEAGTVAQDFKDFMKYALQEDPRAINALHALLKDNVFASIKALLKESDAQAQSYIIDKFAAIFAYEKKYSEKTIGKIIAGRSDRALSLLGPSGEKLDPVIKNSLKEFRETNKNITTSYKDAQKEKINNIFGYTAFYRKDVQSGYMLMSVGDTNILSDSITVVQDDEKSISWLINNLKKEGPEKAMLLENIKKKLSSEYADLLTEEKMFELLEKGETTFENTQKKITIDREVVLYFMAECVNESLGIRINSITAEDMAEAGKLTIKGTTVTYHGEIIPEASAWAYKTHGNGRDGTLNSTYEVGTMAHDLTVTGMWGKRYGKPTPEGSAGESREPSNPNQNAGGGEGKDEGDGTFGSSGSE